MRIEVYLDNQAEPYAAFEPPEAFRLDTTSMDDGDHTLRFKAIDTDGTVSVRKVNFLVRNGPDIAVHGIRNKDLISGEVTVLANAYSSKIGDIFEPMRIETPNPIPTWAWLLFLVVFAWSMWYLAIEYKQHELRTHGISELSGSAGIESAPAPASELEGAASWAVLGKQVYENNCASCHQANGAGLAGLFPPLVGNAAVRDDNPQAHVSAILRGVQDKVIDGISYPSPMPSFGAVLSDEEIAAVINHERSSWGNDAEPVTAKRVAGFRK